MTDAEKIAASLTKAQRGCLVYFTEQPIWWFPTRYAKRTRHRLIDAGLLETRTVKPSDFPFPMEGLALTQIGIAVREILKQQGEG